MGRPMCARKQEKKENKDIGALIGQKLCWTNVEDEISAFRKTMARFVSLTRPTHHDSPPQINHHIRCCNAE